MSPKPYPSLILVGLLVCIFLGIFNKAAHAQSIHTQGQTVGILIAIAAIRVEMGIGDYFLARRAPSITGCATSCPGGMTLEDDVGQTGKASAL
jgi:hypothetical protein